MNRLIIIGNGFDMAHGLKTSYMDFIDWYWAQRVNTFANNTTKVSKDSLCRLIINDNSDLSSWSVFSFNNSYFYKDIFHKKRYSGTEIIQEIQSHPGYFSVECSPFFQKIMQSIEAKGWVDIENDYYQILKDNIDNPNCHFHVSELNEELAFLQSKLVEYLLTIKQGDFRNDLAGAMQDNFNPSDFSTEGKKKALDNIGLDISDFVGIRRNPEKYNKALPERTMILSFNYTETAERYGDDNTVHNYIHGKLDDPQHIIFGYGDELDKKYQDMVDKNDNEFLRNLKSVRYLETRNYHDMLEFLSVAPFQVMIMGHSCGNSDRTLLNTVFEHENCVSIKPFYHVRDDGTDNYMEIVQNISRNFTNMKLYRDRVVNKKQCTTM